MEDKSELDLTVHVKRGDVLLPEHQIKVLKHTRLSEVVGLVMKKYYPKECYGADDFDLYLSREGEGDKSLMLDQRKSPAYYCLRAQEVLEARRKILQITLNVNLQDGDSRKIKVDAYLTVAEAARAVCQHLAIVHYEELSLVMPPKDNATQRSLSVIWMKSSASLNSQGVKDGDTVLLRKKVFVKNEDFTEAMDGNKTLLDLVYSQVVQMFTGGDPIPLCVDIGMVCSLLHHIEQGEKDISDKESLKKVVPKKLQEDQTVYEQAMKSYQKQNVHLLQKFEAKCRLLKELSKPRMTTGIFPVKEHAAGMIVIDSKTISLCSEDKGRICTLKEWPLTSVKEFKSEEECFRMSIVEEWHQFDTGYSAQIFDYLSDVLLATGNGPTEQPPESLDSAPAREGVITIVAKQNGGIPSEPEIVMVMYPEGFHSRVVIEVEDTQPAIEQPAGGKNRDGHISRRKEVRFHDRKQIYLGIDCGQLLKCYRLFHFVILGKDIRALLVNTSQTVNDIIFKICDTFGIKESDDLCLYLPKAVGDVLAKYGGKPGSSFERIKKLSLKRTRSYNVCLDGTKALSEQYDFDIKPYVLHLERSVGTDETDAPEETLQNLGEEWPDFEEASLALQREFHQCWCGVIQGDYPVTRQTAVKLAALLNGVYNGSFEGKADYSIEVFLPPMYCKSPGIIEEVQQACLQAQEKYTTVVMEEAIQLCRSVVTYEGVFFDVDETISQRPWRKTKHRMFGINHQGVINVDPKSGKVLFVHRFSDISKLTGEGQLVHLSFGDWDEDYNAHTYQAGQIMEVLDLYIGMTKRGQIEQAPSHPRQ